MESLTARSYNDGIDFFANGTDTIISARRTEDGKIVVTKNSTRQRQKEKKSKWLRAIKVMGLLVLAIVYSWLRAFCISMNWDKFSVSLLLPLMWMGVWTYYYIVRKNPKTPNLSKYHAAEHKVLNYCDQYGKQKWQEMNCDKVMKMSSISIRCGSTVIAVVLVFITMLLPGVIYIPWVPLKLIWGAVSSIATMCLWANGKCNFLQKMVLEEPEAEEVELAILGMKECIKISK